MLTSNAGFSLLFLLSTSQLTTQATEPYCSGVADFSRCQGDALDFCPKGISCACKDQVPFCMCPSYQANYLYMGPKCNLWSTLDVILVCAVPAVTAAAIVAVSLQWISYCRSKPKKRTRHSTRASPLRSQAQALTEQVPNPTNDPRYALPQKGVKAQSDAAAPNFKFPLISVQPYEEVQPTPIQDFRYISQQPMRQAISGNRNVLGAHPSAAEPFNVWESEIPDVDYEEENPFAAMAMRQLSNVGTPALPRPSYNSPQPANHQYAQRGGLGARRT